MTSTVTPTPLSEKGQYLFALLRATILYNHFIRRCIIGALGFQHHLVHRSQKNIAHLTARATMQGSLASTSSNTIFQHLTPRDSNFGRTGTPFQRILLPEYARGTLDLPRKSSVDNSQLPSARDISNALSQGSNRVDTANTVLVMQVERRKKVSKFYVFSSDGPVHRSRHHPHSKPWNSVLRSKRSVPSVSAILF